MPQICNGHLLTKDIKDYLIAKMPFSYTIDTALDVAFLQAKGTITDEELLSVIRDLNSDSRFCPDYRLLSDYTEVTQDDLTSNSIARVASMSRFSKGTRRAILVNRLTEFGMARMYQSYCSVHGRLPSTIFRNRTEALQYLNDGFPPEKHIK